MEKTKFTEIKEPIQKPFGEEEKHVKIEAQIAHNVEKLNASYQKGMEEMEEEKKHDIVKSTMTQVSQKMNASFQKKMETLKNVVLREEAHNVITLLLEMCICETACEEHEPLKGGAPLCEESCLGLAKLVVSQINRVKEEEIRLDLLKQGGFKVMKGILNVWKNNVGVCRAATAVLVVMAGNGWADVDVIND